MPVTHVQEACTRNLYKLTCTTDLHHFLVQVSCTRVTSINLDPLLQSYNLAITLNLALIINPKS